MPTGFVNWFKGNYGFISQDSGDKDVFVHISDVREAGLTALVEGQTVEFEITSDGNKRKPCATKLRLLGGMSSKRFSDPAACERKSGSVKFFTKGGYGFIVPDGGGEDVFVHVSAIRETGLETLQPGARLTYEIQRGKDARTAAANVRLA